MELHRRSWMASVAVAGGLALVGVGREPPAIAQPVTPPQRPTPKPAVCPTGKKVCSAACVSADVGHGCGTASCNPCATYLSNVEKPLCVRGPAAATVCGYTACKPGWLDDDGDVTNGCETQILRGFSVTPTAPLVVTREQVVGEGLVIYTIEAGANDLHFRDTADQQTNAAYAWLAVTPDQDEPIRHCLDQPFTGFGLTLPAGRGSLTYGDVRVDGAARSAVRARGVRVLCERRFPAPAR